MPADVTYDYSILRAVPRVDRGEQINVGIILSVADSEFLEARIELDEALLRSIDPAVDVAAVRDQLDLVRRICRGGPEAGPIGQLPARSRFRWLVSPRSTMVQPSPVHTGRTSDPVACIERLMDAVVRRPRAVR